MSLTEKNVSKFLFGPLSLYTVQTLRNLKLFFEHQFKIDEWWKLHPEANQNDEDAPRIGSTEKALMTCIGVGYSNLNKVLL